MLYVSSDEGIGKEGLFSLSLVLHQNHSFEKGLLLISVRSGPGDHFEL